MTAPNPAVGALPGWRGTDPDGGTWVRTPDPDDCPWHYMDQHGEAEEWRTQEEAEAAGLVLLHELSEDDVRLLAACRAVSTGIPDPGARIVSTESRSVRIAWAGEDAAPAPLDPTWSHYPVAEVEQAVAEELDATLDLVDEERELATAAVVKRLCEFEPAPLDPGNPEHLRQVAEFLANVECVGGGSVDAVVAALGRVADRLDREHAEAEQDASDRKRAEEIAMVAWADGDGYAQWHNAPEQHRADLIAATLAGLRAGRAERQEVGQ